VTQVNLNHERWLSKKVIEQDIISYYAYLPAFFIENDLSLSFINDTSQIHLNKRYWPNKAPNGKYVIKMSMGMALSYLPFFTLAHLYAKCFNFPTQGFSEPYQFAVLFSSLFYMLIGLLFLWKVLRMFFEERVSLLCLFLICFGTNVFYYLTIGAGLSHTIGFTLMAAFLYYTIKWQHKPSIRTSSIIGLILGLLILVRPINVLAVIFFGLYNIGVFKLALKNRTSIIRNIVFLGVIVVISALVFSPQMMYWKYASGQFLFNSYVGESFYFGNSHVVKALFGFRKGWLIYTPIMIFSIIGIYNLYYTHKKLVIPIVALFIIYVYVCFSWWCWWYGGSFGQRVLIDIYPILSIPLAAFLTSTAKYRLVFRQGIYTALTFLVFLNLFQTMQAKYNIIHFDSMTKANYFEILFTTSKKPDRETYLQHPDYDSAHRGEEEN
jgi:hypothetical protein